MTWQILIEAGKKHRDNRGKNMAKDEWNEEKNEENLEACETVHLDHLAACSALKKIHMF